MSIQYQLVIFDWEGTISDTLGLIFHTVVTEANHLGFGEVDPYAAKKYVSLGLTQAIRKLFPNLTLYQYEQLIQAVQNSMVSKSTELCLIPGVKDLIIQLEALKVDLAIASNKGQHSLAKALQITHMDKYFKVTRSAGQTPPKPCPQMLEEIMDVFGQTAANSLMVGDSPSDIETAQKINMPAIGIDFYHQNEADLKAAGALAVFNDFHDVAKFLNLPKR